MSEIMQNTKEAGLNLAMPERRSFTQLAWAVTIHKSQGKTFAKVIVDIGQGTFAHGQAYVALSRCTTLEGLVLKKPILQRHMLLDSRVVDFMKKFQREDEVMSEKIYSDLGYEDFS